MERWALFIELWRRVPRAISSSTSIFAATTTFPPAARTITASATLAATAFSAPVATRRVGVRFRGLGVAAAAALAAATFATLAAAALALHLRNKRRHVGGWARRVPVSRR